MGAGRDVTSERGMLPPYGDPDRPEAALPPRSMPIAGWGEAGRSAHVSAAAARWLAAEVGPGAPDAGPAADVDTPPVPTATLSAAARGALTAIVGEAFLRDDRESRLVHGGGKSYLDLVAARRGTIGALPDAVVLPADHDAVCAVLTACAAHDVAVVPFGGGTSVVGGVAASKGTHSAVISLDTSRLDDLVRLDPEALTVTVGPGLRGPELERALASYRLTLGHFPQSWEHATLGGYAATRSAGQASTGYGRFDELVASLRVATPAGTLRLGHPPASAAGPDLRGLVLGSEGVFGVITELTLRLHPAPERVVDEGWSFASFYAGTVALRRLAQAGLAPDVARLSDADETRASLALAGGRKARLFGGLLALRGHRGGCLLVAGWEGGRGAVRRRRRAAAWVLRRAGGIEAGRAVGRAWRRGRYGGPYLRDELLDRGYLVETVETATRWSELAALHGAIGTALREALTRNDRAPLVMAHVSHLYPDGASLYFTTIAAADPDDPGRQWSAAKQRVTDTITESGATVTHHHAVGADHRGWMEAEIGPVGVEILRAVKSAVDPTGILNPGKLIPDP